MANPSAPDPDVVAEAYRLTLEPPRGEGMSLAQVALRLGISKTTAAGYVQRAIAHLPMVELLNRAQMQGDMVQRLTTVLFEAYELAAARKPSDPEQDVDEWLAIQEFAARREAQLAALLGLNAPKALSISTNGNGADKAGELRDIGLIKALAKIDESNARDEAAIRAGRPGVIEGS